MGSPANKKASSRKSRCATGHTVTTTSAGSDATAAAPTGWQATIALNDGTHIPQLGLGVYCAANGGETERAVLHALRSGYRHVDTAEIYRNEADSGRGYDAVREALRGSLKKLRLTYVDLYLVHSPNTRSLRLEQWKAMEDLQKENLVKSIGVSNYGIHHLEELLAVCRTPPAVNQIEVNPYITLPELCGVLRRKGIVVEAYSPLTRGQKLGDKKLLAIAKAYGLTGAQLLIQWCLQRGYVVIPKSVKPARIEENNIPADQAPISEADMATLDGFDEYLVTGWDPTKKP
ncbi:oxidoreductase [Aureococcus anophagefferens]|nr:oxidoreductase [Aureococcus anophagefferens]